MENIIESVIYDDGVYRLTRRDLYLLVYEYYSSKRITNKQKLTLVGKIRTACSIADFVQYLTSEITRRDKKRNNLED